MSAATVSSLIHAWRNEVEVVSFLKHNRAWCEENAATLPFIISAMREHLREHPVCQFCAATDGDMIVHHIKPVTLFPELAGDPSNLITLHQPHCHYLIGHLSNWNLWNPDIVRFCTATQRTIDRQQKLRTATGGNS
jgi:hypothetical protein